MLHYQCRFYGRKENMMYDFRPSPLEKISDLYIYYSSNHEHCIRSNKRNGGGVVCILKLIYCTKLEMILNWIHKDLNLFLSR